MSLRENFDDSCEECGKPVGEAQEIIPEMAGFRLMHGLTGRWTCGECADAESGGVVNQ